MLVPLGAERKTTDPAYQGSSSSRHNRKRVATGASLDTPIEGKDKLKSVDMHLHAFPVRI